jgi:4-hydroxy-3-polyprenylbenzoate decarboxylase
MKRLVVGLTGASEVVYGIRLLEVLRQSRADPDQGVETHLVLTSAARVTIAQEINRIEKATRPLRL